MVITNDALRKHILDVQQWIPMAMLTHSDRCLFLARLAFATSKVNTSKVDPAALVLDSVLDAEWVRTVKDLKESQAVLQMVFEPTHRSPKPAVHDATMFDVHDVVQFSVPHFVPAAELARTLLSDMAEGMAKTVPDLLAPRLTCAFPIISPMVAATTASTRLMPVRGVPPVYDDQLRYFDMPPSHRPTYDAFCATLRSNPGITNRQHQIIAVLQAAGIPTIAGKVGVERLVEASGWVGPALGKVVGQLAGGPRYPTVVSIEGQSKVKEHMQTYALTRSTSRRPAKSVAHKAAPGTEAPAAKKAKKKPRAPTETKPAKKALKKKPTPVADVEQDDDDEAVPDAGDDDEPVVDWEKGWNAKGAKGSPSPEPKPKAPTNGNHALQKQQEAPAKAKTPKKKKKRVPAVASEALPTNGIKKTPTKASAPLGLKPADLAKPSVVEPPHFAESDDEPGNDGDDQGAEWFNTVVPEDDLNMA